LRKAKITPMKKKRIKLSTDDASNNLN
jgi:hypothetical protein